MTDYFHLNAAPDTVRAISSLGLAHLGDGVFELMVRSWLCLHGKVTLHLIFSTKFPIIEVANETSIILVIVIRIQIV